jgi:hypothetical protein
MMLLANSPEWIAADLDRPFSWSWWGIKVTTAAKTARQWGTSPPFV